VLYVDDRLSRHPKILAAAQILGGPNDGGRVLALFLDAMSYAKANFTDGFVPDRFLKNSPLIVAPMTVARAMADPTVNLWHRVEGGFQFHDWLDWNKSAAQIKEKREKWRRTKAEQRRSGNGQFQGNVQGGVHRGH